MSKVHRWQKQEAWSKKPEVGRCVLLPLEQPQDEIVRCSDETEGFKVKHEARSKLEINLST
jgi:hypothetical protein